jgi:hypothetical protein
MLPSSRRFSSNIQRHICFGMCSRKEKRTLTFWFSAGFNQWSTWWKFRFKQGAQQGDPLSAYLSDIVVDVLQGMCFMPYEQGSLLHPLDVNNHAPILQYSDDTSILLKEELSQATVIKQILQGLCDSELGMWLFRNQRHNSRQCACMKNIARQCSACYQWLARWYLKDCIPQNCIDCDMDFFFFW